MGRKWLVTGLSKFRRKSVSFQKPELKFSKKFPSPSGLEPQRSLFIFDDILLTKPHFKAWIAKFPFQYPVSSGEKLKDLVTFPIHIEKILSIFENVPERPLQIVCIGGGSVGDFAGFAASVVKRGVDLIQIPSTWLAAIDSAHGGKNALNVGKIKNQIGTFYFPQKIYLVQELLNTQPEERTQEALGEALKISLIQGKSLWKKYLETKKWNSETLWKFLPDLIEGKYQVVKKDPFEKKGHRHILNFGHTLGHVLEAELGTAHGHAVLQGLRFSLVWGQERKILKDQSLLFLPGLPEIQTSLKKLKDPARHLSQDKKRVSGKKIRFVFLKSPGKTVVQSVTVPEILHEVKRQTQ